MTPRGAALRQIGRLFEEGTVAGLPDAQLLRRFLARGDEDAFAALVARHGPTVLAACRSVLRDPHAVEDAFQATFLVLVRKAGSLWVGESLGGWLARVARRVAVQAAVDARRRRDHEARAGRGAALATDPAEPADDLPTIVRAELGRLPERFRLPVVLCDLEGLTRPEAARRLGWTEGTLRGRLATGRERLRARLARRGVGLAGGVLGIAAGRSAMAAVPARWAEAAVRAALAWRADRAIAAGMASPAAVAWSGAVSRALMLGRLARSAAAVMVLGLAAASLAGGAVGPGDAEAGGTPPVPAPAAAAPERPDRKEESGAIVFRGRVLDPDGRPFAGATLSLLTYALKDPDDPPARAVSDGDGRFRFAIPKSAFDLTFGGDAWRGGSVVARADGLAFGVANVGAPDQELTLRLARDDVPIAGRLIDLEGRPVVGARVSVLAVRTTAENDLGPWLEEIERAGEAHQPTYRTTAVVLDEPGPHLVPPATTDADGRFRIAEVGRERLALLIFEGPTIASASAYVRTRPGPTIRLPGYKRSMGSDLVTFYGPTFTHIAVPTRPVAGVVRDRDTHQPLAGITVRGAESLVDGRMRPVSTVTDAEGRYRLAGLPRGKAARIVAEAPADLAVFGRRKARLGLPPDEALPYLRSRMLVPDAPGGGPVALDIGLKRGVWVAGRVIDRSTGEPVGRAHVEYFVYTDNPHLAEAPGFRGTMKHGTFTDAEGRFQLVAFPGPGLIAARAPEDRYAMAVGAETITHTSDRGLIQAHPYLPYPGNYHVLAEIDPADDAREIAPTLAVDPGRWLSGTVLGPAGEPLAGARACGLRAMVSWEPEPLKTAEFILTGLVPGKGRTLTVRHDGRKLIGTLALTGDEAGPVSVRLGPWGAVTGRVVDADGEPRGGFQLMGANLLGDYPEVGPDGRFRLEGLVPGQTYRFRVLEKGDLYSGDLDREAVVRPGEVLDLGDVTVKPPGP